MTCLRAVASVALIAVLSAAHAAVPRDEFAAIVEEVVHRQTTLIAGVGSVHQDVTTESVEAQAFYDQGLGWLHSYFWIEAARSFWQALRVDPKLAMAELRLCRAYRNMGLRAQAREHLDGAQNLKSMASEREQLTIEARAIQWDAIFGPAEDRAKRHNSYRAALIRLIAKYPDDAEGWVARGNAAEARPWGRGQLGRVDSIAWYEAARARDPSHAGAHHYLLHAYENLRLYEHAVRHAEIYAADARMVPHAQHMFAHVLPRVGRWGEALAQFERADTLEREYARRESIPAYADWHHLHNLHLYGMALVREGRLDEADKVLKMAFDTPGQNPIPEVFAHVPYLEYLLHVGRYEDAVQSATWLAETHGPTGEAVGRALAGEALLMLNRGVEAIAALNEARDKLDSLPDRISGPNASSALRRTRPLVSQLDGESSLRDEDPSTVYMSQRTLLSVADRLVDVAGFDGWGEGLLRLERIGRLAKRAGEKSLVEEIRARIGELDPTYTPHFEMPASR